MKILVSAYACEPGAGSEPGIGWNTARELARHHEVWVLTRPDEGRERIEAELAREPVPNLHVVYFTTPLVGWLWRLNQSGAMQLHYYLWQITAYFVARKLHRTVGFDAIQHATFGKYSTPSFLPFLKLPFVFGIVGGAETSPPGFKGLFRFRDRVYEAARAFWRRVGELDPFTRLAARRHSLAIALTRETAARLSALGSKRVLVAPGQAMIASEIQVLGAIPAPPAAPIRFLSIGRLLHWKGFVLGLRAFAAAGLPDAEYGVIGEGPEKARLVRESESLGIASRVTFYGRLSREETLKKLSGSHVLVHPALHDSGPTVCIEAMSAGRPVLALDLGGPAAMLAGGGGLVVPGATVDEAVAGLAGAMKRLAGDSELRRRLGEEGRRRVATEFSWEQRGRYFASLHEELAAGRPARAEATRPAAEAPSGKRPGC